MPSGFQFQYQLLQKCKTSWESHPHHSHRSFFWQVCFPIPGHTVWSPKHSEFPGFHRHGCDLALEATREVGAWWSAQQTKEGWRGWGALLEWSPPTAKILSQIAELIRAPLHCPTQPHPETRAGSSWQKSLCYFM